MKKLTELMWPSHSRLLSGIFTPLWLAVALCAGMVMEARGQAPPNDNLTNATELVGSSGIVYGDNINATAEMYFTTNGVFTNEPPPYINPAGATVWYLWTAPTATTMDFSTRYSTDPNGNELGTVMAVYALSGTNLAYTNLTLIASNEYDPSSGVTNGNVDVTSRVDFPVAVGQTYLIQVDGSTNNAVNGQPNGTNAQGYIELNWGPSLVGGTFGFSAQTYFAGEFDDSLYLNYQPNSLDPSLHNLSGTNNIRITVTRQGGYTGKCEVTLLVTNSLYTNYLITNYSGTNIYITSTDTNSGATTYTNYYSTNISTENEVQDAVNYFSESEVSPIPPAFTYIPVDSLITVTQTNGNGTLSHVFTNISAFVNPQCQNSTASTSATNGTVITTTVTQIFCSEVLFTNINPSASNKVDYVAYSNVLVFNDFQMSQDVYLQINPKNSSALSGPAWPITNATGTNLYYGINPYVVMTLTNPVLDSNEDLDITPPTISQGGSNAYLDILNFSGVPYGNITNTAQSGYVTINLERATGRCTKPAVGGTNYVYMYAILTGNPGTGNSYTCHYTVDSPAVANGFIGSPNQAFDDNRFTPVANSDFAAPAYSAQANNNLPNILAAADFGDPLNAPTDPSGNAAGAKTVFPASPSYTGTLTFGPYDNNGVTKYAEIAIPIYNPGASEFDVDMNVQLYLTVADNQGNTNESVPGVLGNVSSMNLTVNYSSTEPGGAYDVSFNPAGSPTLSYPPNNSTPGANPPPLDGGAVQALAIQPNGQTIIGGYFTTYNTTPVYSIARLLANGWLDTSFNNVLDGGVNGTVQAIVIDANQNIIIGGSFSSYDGNPTPTPNIARLTPTGALDTSFKTGIGFNSAVYALAIDTNGDILVGGDFTSYNTTNCNHIARLLPNGALDTTFLPDTGNGQANFGTDQDVRTIALDGSGNVVLGGDFNYVNGVNLNYLARLLPTGALDPSFVPTGGPDDTVNSLAVETNGEIVIGGAFQNYDSFSSPGVALVTLTGALDTTFPVGSGADGDVYSVVLQPDGKVLIGGQFRNFNLTRRFGMVRLLTNGWVDTSFMDTAYNQYAGLINSYYNQAIEPIHAAYALAVQPDGNIMVGGSFTNIGGGTGTRTTIASQINVTRIIGAPTSGPMTGSGGIGNCPGNITLTQSPYTVSDTAGKLFVTMARVNGSLGPAQVTLGTNTLGTGAGDATASDFGLILPAMPLYNDIYTYWNITPYGSYGWRESDGYYGTNTATQPSYDDSGDSSLNINIYDDLNAQNDLLASLSLLNVTELYITNNGANSPQQASTLMLGGVVIPMFPALGLPSAQLEIDNNNLNVGTVGFSATNYTAINTSNSITLTVLRTNGNSGRVSVVYYTANGTAVAGSNYTAVTLAQEKSVSFSGGANNNSATFTIPILNNSTFQSSKTFKIFLTNASPTSVLDTNVPPILPSMTTVTIIDGNFTPGHLAFTSPTYSVSKGGTATIGVERIGGALGELTVQCGTSNSTAIIGNNYLGSTNTLTWANQDISVKTITVPTLQDNTVDGNLLVNLNLFNATNIGTTNSSSLILYSPSNAVLTIVESDSYGNISFAATNFNVLQTAGQALVTVIRSGGTTGTVSFNYTTANDANPLPGYQTAQAGTNYGTVGGTLTLGPGVSSTNFLVPVYYTPAETNAANRMLDLILTANSTNITGQFPQTATLTIKDPQLVTAAAGAIDFTTRNGIGFNSFVTSLALQPDGRLLAGGNFTFFNHYPFEYVGRLAASGDFDNSFLFDQSGANGEIYAVMSQVTNILQSVDGPIMIVGGFNTVDGVARDGIARLNVDGSVDETFNPGSGADSTIRAITETLLPTGQPNQTNLSYYIGGNFANFNNVPCGGIARVNGSANSPGNPGTVDANFNVGQGITSSGGVYALAVQADNSVILGGSFTAFNSATHNHLIRLNSGGAVDATFNPGAGSNSTDPVQAILVEPNGQILIGGSFTNVTVSNVTYNLNYLARLNADGSVDTNFNVGLGGNDAVLALALDSQQRILVGGEFSRFSGVTRSGITRLNPDGTVDPSINFESGADGGYVDTIAIESDDEIDLGGGFSTFEGTSENNFVRVYGGANSGNGSIQFSGAIYGVLQTGTNAVITLQRLGGEGASNQPPVTIMLSTSDGTAIAGSDYTNVITNVTFPLGETFETVLIPIIDNGQPGSNKFLNLTLSDPTNTVLGAQTTATLFITNVSTAAAFSAPTYRDSANVPGGYASIPVQRIGDPNTQFSITVYTGTNGSATPNVDYTPETNVLTFNSNVMTAYFNVPLLNASNMFSDQTVDIEMTNPTNTSIGSPSSAILTIESVFTGPGVLAFSQPSYAVSEGATNAVITIVRTNGSSGTVSVVMTTSNGTAIAGVNYLPVSITNTFSSATNVNVLIPVIQQSNAGPDLTVYLTLTNSLPSTNQGGPTIGAPDPVVLTILNDIEYFAFAQPSYPITEGNILSVYVNRGGTVTNTATVNYHTYSPANAAETNGYAVPNVDYIPASGTLTFNANVTQQSLPIQVLQGSTPYGPLTFQIILSNPAVSNGQFQIQVAYPGTNTVTINSDLTTFALATNAYSIAENGSNLVVTVNRLNTTNAGSVQFATSDGTNQNSAVNAISQVDYIGTNGTLIFTNGQTSNTFNISILNSNVVENNKTFTVSLSNPLVNSGTAYLVTPSSAAVTITNNLTGISLGSAVYSVNECAEEQAIIPVQLIGATNLPVSVSFTTSNGTAIGGVNYFATNGTINFAPGQTSTNIIINLINNHGGPNITVNLALSSPSNSQLVAPSNAVLTLQECNGITNFVVTPYASSAVLSWNTPVPATAQVAYGLTTNYGSMSSLTGPTSSPVILLTGLARDTNYYFRVMSSEDGTPYTTNGSFATVDTLILNTGDAYYHGVWATGSGSISGYYGSYFDTANTTPYNPDAWAIYAPNIPTPGIYNVYVWYPQSTNFSTNAQIYVYGVSNAIIDSVNQTTNGGGWQQLATNIYLASGTINSNVVYNDTGETNRLVAANAMKWSYVTNQDYPSNGIPPAWWSAFITNQFGTNKSAYAHSYSDYVFGILPTNLTQTPAFSISRPVGSTVSISFEPYQAGRNYYLQSATNLDKPNWVSLTNLPAFNTNTGIATFTIARPSVGTYLRLSGQINAQ